MNVFKLDKIIERMEKMIDNAIDGKPVEHGFDETRMSSLETKLNRYLAMTGLDRTRLAEEKNRVHQLISDISHQTKTPVANILLYSQLLEEADLGEKDRLCAKSLVEQAEKLNFLIASLVKSSRLESGVVALFVKRQPVQRILDSVLRQIDTLAQSKNIEITCDHTDIQACFDLKWTIEAVYNIMDNAVKYTHAGGTVTIKVIAYPLFCRIDIADTGRGISEEETTKIFARFYRSPTVADDEGVGIGLHLAREIVTNEGGYIKVKSAVGKGSVFSVFLPIEN